MIVAWVIQVNQKEMWTESYILLNIEGSIIPLQFFIHCRLTSASFFLVEEVGLIIRYI